MLAAAQGLSGAPENAFRLWLARTPPCSAHMHARTCNARARAQHAQMQDFIKDAGSLTGWNKESHERGMAALRAYTSAGDCRHAALVNFFQPGSMPAEGPCAGGCDNCDRR